MEFLFNFLAIGRGGYFGTMLFLKSVLSLALYLYSITKTSLHSGIDLRLTDARKTEVRWPCRNFLTSSRYILKDPSVQKHRFDCLVFFSGQFSTFKIRNVFWVSKSCVWLIMNYWAKVRSELYFQTKTFSAQIHVTISSSTFIFPRLWNSYNVLWSVSVPRFYLPIGDTLALLLRSRRADQKIGHYCSKRRTRKSSFQFSSFYWEALLGKYYVTCHRTAVKENSTSKV